MSKMFAVLKREYLQAVRKKMFIIMTFLMPFLLMAMMLVPSLILAKGLGDKKVAIIDGTGRLSSTFGPNLQVDTMPSGDSKMEKQLQPRNRPKSNVKIEYVDASKGNPREIANGYIQRLNVEKKNKDQKLDGVLVVPSDAFSATKGNLSYFSRSSTDMVVQGTLERDVNRAIQRQRLSARGMSEAEIAQLLTRLEVEAVQISRSGGEKKGGELNFIIGFAFAALLLIPVLLYGQEFMRGIIQEKTDRVVEILISSMKPMQLLSGKILGLASVGLTQLAVWGVMGAAAAIYAGAMAAAAGFNLAQFFRPEVFIYFLIFFILAYLTYVSVYAIAGSVCNTEKEAQQFIAPIMMVMMLPWFLMMPIIMNPDSKMSVAFSLLPFFAPMVMFVRTLVSEPPMWQILASIAISTVTVYVMFWMTAKIFRIGILSYGKRPTIPELWRWMKVA